MTRGGAGRSAVGIIPTRIAFAAQQKELLKKKAEL
jgi:hypothetical protein